LADKPVERTYRSLPPIEREEARRALAGKDRLARIEAMLRLAFHDPDWRWVQETCLSATGDPDWQVRNGAIMSLEHMARIHKKVDRDRVLPVLRRLSEDPRLKGAVDDALAEIAKSVGTKTS
jgi:hypothetical protein